MAFNPPFKTHDLLSCDGAVHGFFGRKGGVSKTSDGGNYGGLNVGQGSSDRPEDITENRKRVAQALGTVPPNPWSLWQHHSTDVITMTHSDLKTQSSETRPKADGQVTQVPGIALSALSADCGPVLFIDPKSRTIGACHAGWRGAVNGITDATLQAMEDLGAQRENIRAVLGPCISQENYEVGPEFKADFIRRDPSYAAFFKAPTPQSRAHFDLKAFLIVRLKKAGVLDVSSLVDCTYGEPDNYFSYRYNTHHKLGDYGRNISVIMLTE